MVKKAKIDLLDIDINEDNGAAHRDGPRKNAVPDDHEDRAADEEKSGRINILLRLLRIAKLKTYIILIISIGLIMVAGGLIWWLHDGAQKQESKIKESERLKKVIPADEKMVSFDNFVVDVRDQKGERRIAFCDIVIELEKPQTAGAAGERVDVRSAIHAVLKNKQVADGLSPEGRALIKIELTKELDRLLGERAVKNIYITRFEVI